MVHVWPIGLAPSVFVVPTEQWRRGGLDEVCKGTSTVKIPRFVDRPLPHVLNCQLPVAIVCVWLTLLFVWRNAWMNQIFMPFIVVSSSNDTVIQCEMAENREDVFFNFR